MKTRAISILIVDDSPEDRDTYKSYLEQQTTQLLTFLEEDDAEKGLEVCTQVELDCILIDYHLPGIDGVTFLRQLQQLKKTNEVPIVMITGRGTESTAVEALKLGASDYLVKSEITPENLYRATKNAIDKNEASKEIKKQIAQKEVAEEELRKSEEKLRLLIEAVKDYALIMIDVEMKIVSWNSGATRIFGFHSSEILGQKIRRIFTQSDIRNQEPENECDNALQKGWIESERWYARRDGSEFWASGILRPIYDISGLCTGFVKILRDETERLHKENQLRDALKTINEVMQNKDDFLNNASHELKTPLTSLKLQVQMLRGIMDKKHPEITDGTHLKTTIAKAERQINKLTTIVEDLIDVSRIHGNRLQLSISRVNISELLLNAISKQTYYPDFESRKIRHEIQADIMMDLDEKRILQVFVNLLTNIAKIQSNRDVQIKLSATSEEVILEVIDYGCSLSNDELEKLFSKYERLDPKNFMSEMGLGLFISRKIAEAHNGSLNSYTLEEGCSFKLRLPFQKAEIENGTETHP